MLQRPLHGCNGGAVATQSVWQILRPSPAPAVMAARTRLSAPLAGFPERDQDPIYTPLAPQPWDVKITAESQMWKK